MFWYDTQGESLYTNPPNPNAPSIDHGLDEENIWAFRKTNYNQQVIYNPYTRGIFSSIKERKAPWWGIKLASPHFYKTEKFDKFLQQYAIRIEFETLKLRHARELKQGDMAQRDRMKEEISSFIENAKLRMQEIEMQDVYVTDHKPKAAKYSTLSEEEDLEYFNYVKSLEEYNARSMRSDRLSRFESGRFERGSLKQRLFEPLADAQKLENGTVYLELTDKDLGHELDEERLRAQFNKLSSQEALEGEDEAEVRASMFDAMERAGVDIEEWDKILAREFDTFKSGEKYDYVTDLRRTFDTEVATPTARKIFKRLPSYVFWDIKKPVEKNYDEMYLNPYNTARKYPYESFFDMRRHEDWL